MTSKLIIAVFGGLSIPVIGASLGFAIVVGAGVALSGWALVGRRPRNS